MNNLQEELQKLKNKFMQQLRNNSDDFSEEAVRSGYVNKMLELFGWDISDLTQIIQERKLTGNEKERLNQIESTNTKPDYELLDKGTLLEFIDTKKPGVDFEEDKKIAFQIRSYGWSAKLPFSIVTNFQKFGVYDTSYTPTSETPTDYKVCYFTIDDLINDIDKYGQFIRRENLVLGNVNISSLGIDQTKKKNEKEIDDHFLEFINRQRITLAQGIVRDNLHFSIESLNNVVQLIINRIIFVRFLEGAHIEPQNELRRLMDVGDFWQKFTELSNTRLFLEYDGAMFKKDSFKLTISDRYFEEFIDNLYGETPYRFNVINPLLIAQIYELFLGEELVIDDSGEIKLEKKRNNPLGSVSTPYQVAKSIVEDEIERFDSVDDIKILDPNAGSGTFLISAFDILVQKKEEVLSRKLTFNEMKEIITKQLFAVDIDFGAIQVLRMGISLKLMLGNYVKPVIFKKALSEYKENFILGNTIINREKLSDSDWEHEEIIDSLPLSYQEAFPAIMEDGGFDLIISNPPYVEPKLYTKKWPYSYGLLKDMYGFPKEKIDSSLFFLKRYFELLKNGGKLGIIIQRRFFATKYGQSIRKWLSKEGYLEEILSIQDNSLFKGRTTYVAVLYGQKNITNKLPLKIICPK